MELTVGRRGSGGHAVGRLRIQDECVGTRQLQTWNLDCLELPLGQGTAALFALSN
jgi:hypothetical protein